MSRAKNDLDVGPTRMLIAGVGNIFLGDDAFGVEVVRQMAATPLPEGVELIDSGIRGVHLAYQLLDGYDVLVLIDAAPRGHPPGTVSLLQVDRRDLDEATAAVAGGQAPLIDAHGMEPGSILKMLGSLGGQVARVLVVACEPESVEQGLGLSEPVLAAVPRAIALVEQLMHGESMTLEEPVSLEMSVPVKEVISVKEVSR
jgi:hydrogenase maturation protease